MIQSRLHRFREFFRFRSRRKVLWFMCLVLAGLYWAWLPSRLFTAPYSTVLCDANGDLLGARIAGDGQWRFPGQDSVPYKFRHCLLQFEDAYFYRHPGVNPLALIRSAKTNLSNRKRVSGGSTITMQLARMLRGKRERTYAQKLIEIFLAIRIELSYSKNSILGQYAGHAPFGGNVVGLEAASWRYFGRPPYRLSWAEAATLAVLPNAPSLIYPGKNEAVLLGKRNRLLKKLEAEKIIDTESCRLAMLEELPGRAFPIPQIAPHLLVRAAAEHGEGGNYKSTVRRDLQLRTRELLDQHVQSLAVNGINNACALVADLESGKVLAYVGNSSSRGNLHENFVDVIRSPRSTGSILKPFLYAFMLHENKMLPACLLEDVPTRLGSYGPRNFGLGFDGLVPAHMALARSLNVPAIKMLQEYGTGKFHLRLKQLGFTTFSRPSDHYGLSLILGGGEASLWEIAGAYASMGRALSNYNNQWDNYVAGSYHPLVYLEKNEEPKKIRIESDLLSASALFFTFKAMTELMRPQDYVGWRRFESRHDVSWKTGTSFGFRDAWSVGMNGKYLVAVWVGNADGEGRPELTGTAAAAPLMFSIFNLLPEKKWFQRPHADLESIRVCTETGYRASEICEKTDSRMYPKGSNKTRACGFHQVIHLDSTGRHRVNSNCYPVNKMQHKAWFVATPVQEYYYRQRSAGLKPLPPYLPGCESESHQKQLEIMYPREGFQVYVPVHESGERGQCVLKATHRKPKAKLFWYIDGEFVGQTEKFHQLAILPAAGKHQLHIVDESGESATCGFSVLEKSKS